MKTGYAHDPRMTKHGSSPKAYFNDGNRLAAIDSHLRSTGLMQQLTITAPLDSPMVWIRKVHSAEHIAKVKTIPVWTGDSVALSQCSELAVASVLGAVKAVCEGTVNNAFCNVHPAGHHVIDGNSDSLSIYCYANAAIAAKYAHEQFGMKRILIIDWDLHEANGTRTYFYDDTTTFILDMPQHVNTAANDSSKTCFDLYAPEFCPGKTKNIFLCSMSKMFGYKELSMDKYEMVMESFKSHKKLTIPLPVDLVIISCGFDAMKNGDDPGSLTASAYSRMTMYAMTMAKEITQDRFNGRVVSILEGGYADRPVNPYDPTPVPHTYNALTACAEYHIKTLLSGKAIYDEHPWYSDLSSQQLTKKEQKPIVCLSQKTVFLPVNMYDEVKFFTMQGKQLFGTTIPQNATKIDLAHYTSNNCYIAAFYKCGTIVDQKHLTFNR